MTPKIVSLNGWVCNFAEFILMCDMGDIRTCKMVTGTFIFRLTSGKLNKNYYMNTEAQSHKSTSHTYTYLQKYFR